MPANMPALGFPDDLRRIPFFRAYEQDRTPGGQVLEKFPCDDQPGSGIRIDQQQQHLGTLHLQYHLIVFKVRDPLKKRFKALCTDGFHDTVINLTHYFDPECFR